MVTDEQIQKAVDYLADTDSKHARARAEYNSLSELRKTVLAYSIDEEGKGFEERKHKAYKNPDYVAHIERIKEAEIAFHDIHNKRQRAMALIELYRTMSANQRRGNI